MSNEVAKIKQEMFLVRNNKSRKIDSSLNPSEPVKLLAGCSNMLDMNVGPCSDSEGGDIVDTTQNLAVLKCHDASYAVPKLFYELEVEIFARVPCFEYWKLQFLNKRFSQLLKSCEIFKVRRERGLLKPYVFVRSGCISYWTMFDKDFENSRILPDVPSNLYFNNSDKETICAGTQVIVVGREEKGIVVWRYELERHKWFKGPSMIMPRTMYGSASHGTDAFFAGGLKINEKWKVEVVSIAEKYNADTKKWTMIHEMNKKRKYSSGCFLHGKFYVIGGQDENDKYLTCGESYDEATDSWELIPDMLSDMTFTTTQSPPLIAVVDDNLYSLVQSSNELRVYNANTNSWKKLGVVPVRADDALGWGIAFKSLGDKLLVIGPSFCRIRKRTMGVYTCRPSPDLKKQLWKEMKESCNVDELHHYIHNCCIMFA